MITILFVLILTIFLYIKLIKPYSTWKKRGLKQTTPPYVFGDNAGTIFGKQSFYDIIRKIYNSFPNERYVGFYQMTSPVLMIRDPELIKSMTIKDFDHFVNHRQFMAKGTEPLWNRNLVALKDAEWKHMRMILTPTFTSAKMRGIFNLIADCCKNYVTHFKEKNSPIEIDLKNLATRYTNDVIATVAFGIDCDSINEVNNEFFTMAKSISANKNWWLIAFSAYALSPSLAEMLNLPVFPRETTDFFTNVVRNTIKIREEKGIIRPDMIHLLMETKKENSIKNERFIFTPEDMAAQAFIFYLAGFESVATTIIFMGHSLTVHPQIQTKLQQEIDKNNTECDGKISYESLQKMKYLDMVISETLRKWPALPVMDRVCTKSYTLPETNQYGKPIEIFPGEVVIFPTIALHYDPEYFPDPEKFDPERFNEENKEKINPYTYAPFGLGPRNCIASRLAVLEIKLFYYYFLRDFEFVRTPRTVHDIVLSKRTVNMKAESDVFIGIQTRSK